LGERHNAGYEQKEENHKYVAKKHVLALHIYLPTAGVSTSEKRLLMWRSLLLLLRA
jgi:hypothetical protein